ncbi:MAG: AbrB/MazE/SpoVT family DNA-binding domain-containing protein [Candidatus Woesearchaeota archaeon]
MIESIRMATISSKRQIIIPKEFVSFKPGNKAIMLSKGDYIIIRPMSKKISETALLSDWSLSEGWNSKEDEEAFAYLQ